LIHLNDLEVDRMVVKNDWGVEIEKKIPTNFDKMMFADIILPITFNNGIWVMMTWNFE
jgi:hypothetical protein